MDNEYVFSFAPEGCIQCFGCEAACKSWRADAPGVRRRRVLNLWRGAFPDVKNTSLTVACMHCVDPECLKACPEEAITKRKEDGMVLVEGEKCTGCMICLEACPYGVPQFGGGGRMEKCDFCVDEVHLGEELPPCAGTCPTGALTLVRTGPDRKIAEEKALHELLTTRIPL